ncbi:MAG: sulfotransferase [Planctomycetota bacterium]|nr:sulfotransferase [Planctomycetota bacterium]
MVGVPRSGTTRLSNIISSSPEFHRERGDAVETHLVNSLPNFYKWKDPGPLLRYLGGKSGVESIIDRGIKTLRDSSADRKRKAFVQLYFFAMMHACQPKRIVEKTPLHIFSADFLWCCFPKAHFVCCYRDPRAVYGSMRRRREVELDRGKRPDDWLNQSPSDFAKFYRDITRQFLFLQAKLNEQILPFQYEGFVSAPEESLCVLFNKLESEFKPEAMTADHFEQGNTSDPLLYQPVADYGKYWDEFLRPDDASKIFEICGGDLDSLARWSNKLGFTVQEAKS